MYFQRLGYQVSRDVAPYFLIKFLKTGAIRLMPPADFPGLVISMLLLFFVIIYRPMLIQKEKVQDEWIQSGFNPTEEYRMNN